jgi:hypothetical protein
MINTSRVKDKLSPEFIQMIEFFNNLEDSLKYPNCEGYNDELLYLTRADKKFNNWINNIILLNCK